VSIQLLSRIRALLRAKDTSDQSLSNLEENRQYWNRYAQTWSGVFGGYELKAGTQSRSYRYLGDEWGHPDHVTEILDEFVYPYATKDAIVVEIGAGGGRLAARVAPRVKHLHCLDISVEMLNRLRVVLCNRDNVSFVHVTDATFPPDLTSDGADFVYAFDVFVHLDVHTMWKYLRQIGLALRPGGVAFLHTTNLLTKGGWRRFESQDRFTLEGHYFITPEVVKTLAARAGLTVAKEAEEDPANFYKARDYLVLLRK
jgi:SAM-dependent methyltransferase